MYKCPSCKNFASLSAGTCWKCQTRLVDTDRRKNAHVRRTIPYDGDSDAARRATDLLQRVGTIRMRQDDGPGSGHFAAGSSALEGLIRLGFAGAIEVFHQADDAATSRMRTCYEGFPAGRDATGPMGNRVRIDFTALPHYDEDPLTEALLTRLFFEDRGPQTLGLLGASDGFGNADEGLEDDTVSPAQALNTRFGVVLQPFAWPRVRAIADAESGYFAQILQDAPFASYMLEVPDLLHGVPSYQRGGPRAVRVIQDYVSANAGDMDADVVRTVTATLAKTAAGGCHLMPLYGLHAGANQLGGGAINALVRAVRALRLEGFLDGPVVVFNIAGRYPPDAECLEMCTVLPANQGQSARRITDALDGIFVVQSPGLRKPLFNQLAANATLPMLLEGANTANLCVQLGTPFLALADNDSIPTLDVVGARGHVVLRRLAGFLGGDARVSPEQATEIAGAIRDAVTPDTALHRYFRGVHERARAPASDQLAVALSSLRQAIDDFAATLPPIQPVHLAPVPLPARRPSVARGTIHLCPSCRRFARIGPGSCPRCSAQLEPR